VASLSRAVLVRIFTGWDERNPQPASGKIAKSEMRVNFRK